MKERSTSSFFKSLFEKKELFPFSGQLELTYRCNLDCIHCYCKGSENKEKELNTGDWKKILDEIQREGALSLTFTGGDIFVREDFLEIYAYAKEKGFIITLFTNGFALDKKIIDSLVRLPPFCIEITLNGISKETYESITQTKGSFERVIENIKLIHKNNIRLILKSNCLKQNKDEIAKVKAFTENLLGKPSERKYRFKYDPMIYPRLNGDKTPNNYRLSFEELVELKKQDKDIWKEYQKGIHADFPEEGRDKSYLYRCNSWMNQFFVNPYGRLKFCMFSDKFSVDLKKTSLREGFYFVFPQVLLEKFKTDSKCRDCYLKPVCYHCPARAFLETGDEETPVEYYCELAKATYKEMEEAKKEEVAKK